jgi:transposase
MISKTTTQNPSTLYDGYVGIDVGKNNLVIAYLPTSGKTKIVEVSNDEKGFQQIRETLKQLNLISPLIALEATGTYHQPCMAYLLGQNYTVSILRSNAVKYHQKSEGQRHKTDKADALAIGLYAKQKHPKPCVLASEAQAELQQIQAHKDQIIKQLNALQGLVESNNFRWHQNEISNGILAEQIAHLESLLKRLIEEERRLVGSVFAIEIKLLQSIPGIGHRSALLLLAHIGDASGFDSSKALSKYFGLEPVPNESGRFRGKSRISKQGNSDVRRVLYVASWSAVRFNKVCHNLYERLLAKGKTKMEALIAVAHKLVRQAFGVLKSRQAFDPNFHLQKR